MCGRKRERRGQVNQTGKHSRERRERKKRSSTSHSCSRCGQAEGRREGWREGGQGRRRRRGRERYKETRCTVWTKLCCTSVHLSRASLGYRMVNGRRRHTKCSQCSFSPKRDTDHVHVQTVHGGKETGRKRRGSSCTPSSRLPVRK